MREANSLQSGSMHNSIDELQIIHRIGVHGVSSKAPKIVLIHWLPLLLDWIKVNTDGTALGCYGLAGCGSLPY